MDSPEGPYRRLHGDWPRCILGEVLHVTKRGVDAAHKYEQIGATSHMATIMCDTPLTDLVSFISPYEGKTVRVMLTRSPSLTLTLLLLNQRK